MNLFDDLLQRVNLLNAQLRSVQDDLGSEPRRILYNHLWGIVGELNARLKLGLDNTALDLRAEENRLVVHYYARVAGSTESEVTMFIDRSFSVEKHTKDVGTGSVEISLD
jgi:hypothetical protein